MLSRLWARPTRAAVVLAIAIVLSGCGLMGGDHTNLAELERAATATHAVTGSVDGAGVLAISTEESLVRDGVSLSGVRRSVDLVDYRLEPGRTYAFLVKVSSDDGDSLGDSDDLVLLYAHDPTTDEPAEGHSDRRTESGKSAIDVLDCLLQARADAETRFAAFAATIAQDSRRLWDCN